jgi:hypothetical protein
MWIAQANNWDKSHTDLSKYFIERLKQRVDYEEIISNRHRTTNGYTLIAEIVEVATLAQKRIKSVNRLISLINEAKSTTLRSSIINDYILQTYHSDIIEYYQTLNAHKLKEGGKELLELLNKSKINVLRLKQEYYANIKLEVSKIDFKSKQFERNSIILDKIIDGFIPYLLHQGYSTTSISDIAYRFIKKLNGSTSALRIIGNFDGVSKPYVFLIKTLEGRYEFDEVIAYLKGKGIDYRQVKIEQIRKNLFEDFQIDKSETLFVLKHSTLDPHNFLRNIYEIALKNYVITNNRLTLQFFTDFFDSVYWRFDRNENNNYFQKSNMSIDPINVPKRKSTLRSTLVTLSQTYDLNFDDQDSIPIIKSIRDSLYYYNLALGSKSIENSLSLLWTSLETLLPYRLKDNDIENVQYFVSKSLSIGAIGREVVSFAERFLNTHWFNDHSLGDLGLYTNYLNYAPEGIKKWIEWLSVNYSESDQTDPYDTLKEASNLLCKEFCFLNDIYTGKHSDYKTVKYWLDKIDSSEKSMAFQLDRIYLHRNQIVHSGKFINEYSNLWNHLEWYVGKLLSYCVIDFIKREDKDTFNKEELFMKLEADADALKNLLSNNQEKTIKEIYFARNLATKHSWQFF